MELTFILRKITIHLYVKATLRFHYVSQRISGDLVITLIKTASHGGAGPPFMNDAMNTFIKELIS